MEISGEYQDCAMDTLLVLKKENTVHNQQLTTERVIQESAYINFGNDIRVLVYEKCYVIEFPNKTRALKALKEGLDVGYPTPLPLISMYRFFGQLD